MEVSWRSRWVLYTHTMHILCQ